MFSLLVKDPGSTCSESTLLEFASLVSRGQAPRPGRVQEVWPTWRASSWKSGIHTAGSHYGGLRFGLQWGDNYHY